MHIGDEELHYLKILMDQIFERENFIATIPRKTRSGKSDVSWKLSQDFDWILIYTKKAPRQTHLFKRAIERKYHTSPDFPNDPWRLSDLTTQRTTEERRNSDFTLINPKNGQKFPVNPQRSWSVTKDTVDEYIQNGKIVFPGDYDFLDITVPAMRTFRSEEIARYGEDFDKTYVSSDFLNQAMDKLLGTDFYNKKGTDEIIELFGSKKFDYPKNELLMKKIIEFSTEEGDIVLDFFAGSGTTGAVAHKMNRQYILIEQMDYIEDITLERLKKVIEGDEVGVSEELGWKGGGELVYLELKAWNQLFIEEIVSAEDEELPGLLEKILKRAQLSYLVNKSNIDKKEFNKLEPENQRQLLIELLDKNQLYVNYSEIDDEEYGVSQEEKKISKQFYGDGE